LTTNTLRSLRSLRSLISSNRNITSNFNSRIRVLFSIRSVSLTRSFIFSCSRDYRGGSSCTGLRRGSCTICTWSLTRILLTICIACLIRRFTNSCIGNFRGSFFYKFTILSSSIIFFSRYYVINYF
jgi:hypothetical protein